MPQTMLAIMAMVLTSFFAFNQHRSVLSSRMSMIAQEVELRSTAVAVDLLEEIGALSFDEATKDGAISSASQLTPLTAYSTSEQQNSESSQPDDLDDFDQQTRMVTRTVGDSQLSFTGSSRVKYINSDGVTAATSPTKYKQLTVVVKSLDFAIADSVSISKIISCGSRCNW